MGILPQGSSHGDQVNLLVLDDLVGEKRVADSAHANDGHFHFLSNVLGLRNEEALHAFEGSWRASAETAGNVNDVDARGNQFCRELLGVLDASSLCFEVIGAESIEQQLVSDLLSDAGYDFEGESDSVGQRATVLVGALVCER